MKAPSTIESLGNSPFRTLQPLMTHTPIQYEVRFPFLGRHCSWPHPNGHVFKDSTLWLHCHFTTCCCNNREMGHGLLRLLWPWHQGAPRCWESQSWEWTHAYMCFLVEGLKHKGWNVKCLQPSSHGSVLCFCSPKSLLSGFLLLWKEDPSCCKISSLISASLSGVNFLDPFVSLYLIPCCHSIKRFAGRQLCFTNSLPTRSPSWYWVRKDGFSRDDYKSCLNPTKKICTGVILLWIQ